MKLNRDDIKAYLAVLGYPPAGNHVQNIPGCLCRLEEQLVQLSYDNKQYRATLDLLKYREKLNGYLPHEHPQLRTATRQLAELLTSYMETFDGRHDPY